MLLLGGMLQGSPEVVLDSLRHSHACLLLQQADSTYSTSQLTTCWGGTSYDQPILRAVEAWVILLCLYALLASAVSGLFQKRLLEISGVVNTVMLLIIGLAATTFSVQWSLVYAVSFAAVVASLLAVELQVRPSCTLERHSSTPLLQLGAVVPWHVVGRDCALQQKCKEV